MQAVIIGNGIAGITAAQRLRRLKPDWTIKVISGESAFYYSRPALMYIYMGHMGFAETKPYEDWHWDQMRIERVRLTLTNPDATPRVARLNFAKENNEQSRALKLVDLPSPQQVERFFREVEVVQRLKGALTTWQSENESPRWGWGPHLPHQIGYRGKHLPKEKKR